MLQMSLNKFIYDDDDDDDDDDEDNDDVVDDHNDDDESSGSLTKRETQCKKSKGNHCLVF